MASDEISEKNVEAVTEANLRRWMQVVACMIVIAGVCWCGSATWCEETAAKGLTLAIEAMLRLP